jgi:hypothetical protein
VILLGIKGLIGVCNKEIQDVTDDVSARKIAGVRLFYPFGGCYNPVK